MSRRPNVRMDHHRDPAFAWMAGVRPGFAVERDLAGQLLDIVAEQVREQPGAHLPGGPEGVRVPRAGQPHRQLRAHRPREGAQLDLGAVAAHPAVRSRRATADGPRRCRPASLVCAGRTRQEQARSRVDASPRRRRHRPGRRRQVVHQRPFLGNPQRVVQRQDDTAGPDRDPVGDAGQQPTDHRRIRIEPTEPVKVSLRRPDRRETMLVSEPGALFEQLVRVGVAARTVRDIAEIEQAEVDRPDR